MPSYPVLVETYDNGAFWEDVSGSTSGSVVDAISGIVRDGYTYQEDLTGNVRWGTSTVFTHFPPTQIRVVRGKIS